MGCAFLKSAFAFVSVYTSAELSCNNNFYSCGLKKRNEILQELQGNLFGSWVLYLDFRTVYV